MPRQPEANRRRECLDSRRPTAGRSASTVGGQLPGVKERECPTVRKSTSAAFGGLRRLGVHRVSTHRWPRLSLLLLHHRVSKYR